MPVDRDPRESQLIAGIDSVLASGRTTLADLTATLRDRGLLDHVAADPDDETDEVLRLIHRDDTMFVGSGDVVVLIDQLVRGTVMTHRLTEHDLDRGMLDADPDLELLDKGWLEPMRLDGAAVERVFPDEFDAAGQDGSFMGPSGWLDPYRPGDLLALRRDDAQLTLERVDDDDVGAGDAEIAALRSAFDRAELPPGVGELIEVVVLDALLSTPDLFRRPVRPIGELLADAGLSCQGEWTGPADVDWLPEYIASARAEFDLIADRYQLDDCCLDALDDALALWNDFVMGRIPVRFTPDSVDAFAHGSVAAAFADYVLREDPAEPSPLLAAFADSFAGSAHKLDRAIGAYLTARNLECGGSAMDAEAALEAAVELDPQFEPALEDLAWFASDRSQADKAINLLRRAGLEPDDPQLKLLEAMRPARNVVGRNERCPCGSGRKYKDCCQRRTILPLEGRARWLEHKLWTYVLRPRHQAMPIVLAMQLSPDDDDAAYDFLDTGLPMDLAAFEGGLADAFLQQRGELLPVDERELLETWLRAPRELWEVVERVTESTVVARRLAVGELVSVAGFHDSASGDLFLARVAPLGRVARLVGTPIRVPVERRGSAEALLASEPDAWAIAGWFESSNRG